LAVLAVGSLWLVVTGSGGEQPALAQAGAQVEAQLGAPAPEAIYLVGSEEQLATVQWEQDYANRIRAEAGEPTVRFEVVFASTPLIERTVRFHHAELNAVLVRAGQPAITLTDLR
jgi:hypothetical protein